MTVFRHSPFIVIILLLTVLSAAAQDRPIGYWRSHLPYNLAVGVASNGTSLYTVTPKAFFTFRPSASGTPVPYSKVEGMSDIGMQSVAYDVATGTTVLVYENGNIDLFKENENTFYNIPDFKIKSISGTKSVNGVFAENGTAYISTSIGVLVIDLATHNVEETYKFIRNNETIPVTSFIRNGGFFYAITGNGVYRAATTNPQLQNFQVWGIVDSASGYTHASSVNDKLYVANNSSVSVLLNDTFHVVYTCDTDRIITTINAGHKELFIGLHNFKTYLGTVLLMDNGNSLVDSFNKNVLYPAQAVQLSDNDIWIADAYNGLARLKKNWAEVFVPDGPADPESFDIYAHNKSVWVAHSSYTDILFAKNSFNGVSNVSGDKWKHYKRYAYPPFENMDFFVSLAKDEGTGTMYMASFVNGLFTLNKDGSYEILNRNSIFDTSRSVFGDGQRQLAGVALDKSGNVWVTSVYSYHQLYAKSNGNWYKFHVPGTEHGGPVVVDDNGQAWFVSLKGGGLYVYDPKGTIEDPSDDEYYSFSTGVGSGNLPSNNVLCVARDNNDNIWVGTDNGIGIISNCNAPGPCDAQLPIVQYDQFAGYLFAGNAVRTIAVDGGNRKWVGTDDGIWLLSPDAQQIVYRFNAENSPLPSNLIRKISIDKVTGDVYVGTQNGMVSFRSTATEGGKTNSNVQVFPNPVHHDYTGTIAIKGLATNADVRITDVNGQLVYKTKAYGGQAVWDGKDYKGRKPQSGVYLVFVSSSDGEQTYTGKIVFMQ
ncbi:MAG: Two component regulator propeller [Flavipsychrobacter sp.]|nr:Two component regulator propeller [Flavipsychrobacter sp.]